MFLWKETNKQKPIIAVRVRSETMEPSVREEYKIKPNHLTTLKKHPRSIYIITITPASYNHPLSCDFTSLAQKLLRSDYRR